MSFAPKFEWINCRTAEETFEEVASKINRPHEDYPYKVPATLEAINLLIKNKVDYFTSYDARTIHSLIFPGRNFSGVWRKVNVKIGNDKPISYLLVPDAIEQIFPVTKGKQNLVEWYKQFQTIHPFQDGNGRVGGVIVAVLSWDGDKMLAPLQ